MARIGNDEMSDLNTLLAQILLGKSLDKVDVLLSP